MSGDGDIFQVITGFLNVLSHFIQWIIFSSMWFVGLSNPLIWYQLWTTKCLTQIVWCDVFDNGIWNEEAIDLFWILIQDAICSPFYIIALLNVTRWSELRYWLQMPCRLGDDLSQIKRSRHRLAWLGLASIGDMILLAVLVFLIPFPHYFQDFKAALSFFSLWKKRQVGPGSSHDEWMHIYDDIELHIAMKAMVLYLIMPFPILCAPSYYGALVLHVFCPARWGAFRGNLDTFDRSVPLTSAGEGIGTSHQECEIMLNRLQARVGPRGFLCLMEVFACLADTIIFTVPSLFAVLSPLRHTEAMKIMGLYGTKDVSEQQAESFRVDSSDMKSVVAIFNHSYNVEKRMELVGLALLGLMDILYLPLLVPLFVTFYRLLPIWGELAWQESTQQNPAPANMYRLPKPEETTHEGPTSSVDITRLSDETDKENLTSKGVMRWTDFQMVFRQNFLLLLDVVHLPLLLILLVTFYRFGPIKKHYIARRDEIFGSLVYSLSLYGLIWLELILMCLDILLAPLTAIVLLTHYHSAGVRYYMFHPDVICGLDAPTLGFHLHVLISGLIVICDLLFFPMCFALLCILHPTDVGKGPESRLAVMRQVFSTPEGDGEVNEENTTEREYDVEDDSVAARMARAEQARAERARDASIFHVEGPPLCPQTEWRPVALCHFLESMTVGMFTSVGSAILILTVWRLKHCFRHFESVGASSDPIMTRRVRLLKLIWIDVAKNILDICCLPLAAVIIGTLYRALGYMIQLYREATSTVAVNETVQLGDCDVNISFQPRGGPRLEFVGPPGGLNSADRVCLEHVDEAKGAKLFIIGTELWCAIEKTFGSTIAGLGRIKMPLRLQDGRAINLREFLTAVKSEENMRLSVDLGSDFDFVSKKTLQKKLSSVIRAMPPGARFLMQVEGETHSGETVVLACLNVRGDEFLDAVTEDAGVVSTLKPSITSHDSSNERENQLREQAPVVGIADAFAFITITTFMGIVTNIFQCFLVLFTLLMPHRLVDLFFSFGMTVEEDSTIRLQEGPALIRASDVYLTRFFQHAMPVLNEGMKHLRNSRYVPRELEGLSGQDEAVRALEHLYGKYMDTRNGLLSRAESVFQKLPSVSRAKGLDLLLQEYLNMTSVRLKHFTLRHAILRNPYLTMKGMVPEATIPSVLYILDQAERVNIRDSRRASRTLYDSCATLQDTPPKMTLLWRILKYNFLGKKSKGVDYDNFDKKIVWHAKETAHDVMYFLGLLFICITGAKLHSLTQELRDLGGFGKLDQYLGRFIIKRQLIALCQDSVTVVQTMLLFILCVCTVVSIPNMLTNVPRCRSWERAKRLFIEQLRLLALMLCHFFVTIISCEFLYKTFVGAFSAVFMPAARFAKSLSSVLGNLSEDGLSLNSIVSFLIFCALVGGMVAVAMTNRDDDSSASDVASATFTVVFISMIVQILMIYGVLDVPAMTTSSHKWVEMFEYEKMIEIGVGQLTPSQKDNHGETFLPVMSWADRLAYLGVLVESFSVSCFVMFFFWNGSDGGDEFAGDILLWGSRSGGDDGLGTSLVVANMLVALWALLAAYAIMGAAQWDSDSSCIHGIEVSGVEDIYSPLKTAFSALLTRCLFMYIVMTLLRPMSCTDDDENPRLLSSPSNDCGSGGDYPWSAFFAPFSLVYFLLTSGAMSYESDEFFIGDIICEARRNSQSMNEAYKKGFRTGIIYAPTYTMLVHAGLAFMALFLSLGPALALTKEGTLAMIIVTCALLIILTLAYADACSCSHLPPLRAAGFLAVIWTAVVCQLRGDSDDDETSPTWCTINALYIGWGVCLLLGVCYGMYLGTSSGLHQMPEATHVAITAAFENITALIESLQDTDSIGGGEHATQQILTLNEEFAMSIKSGDVFTELAESSLSSAAKLLLKLESCLRPSNLDYDFRMAYNTTVPTQYASGAFIMTPQTPFTNARSPRHHWCAVVSEIARSTNNPKTRNARAASLIEAAQLLVKVTSRGSVWSMASEPRVVMILCNKIPPEVAYHVTGFLSKGVDELNNAFTMTLCDIRRSSKLKRSPWDDTYHRCESYKGLYRSSSESALIYMRQPIKNIAMRYHATDPVQGPKNRRLRTSASDVDDETIKKLDDEIERAREVSWLAEIAQADRQKELTLLTGTALSPTGSSNRGDVHEIVRGGGHDIV